MAVGEHSRVRWCSHTAAFGSAGRASSKRTPRERPRERRGNWPENRREFGENSSLARLKWLESHRARWVSQSRFADANRLVLKLIIIIMSAVRCRQRRERISENAPLDQAKRCSGMAVSGMLAAELVAQTDAVWLHLSKRCGRLITSYKSLSNDVRQCLMQLLGCRRRHSKQSNVCRSDSHLACTIDGMHLIQYSYTMYEMNVCDWGGCLRWIDEVDGIRCCRWTQEWQRPSAFRTICVHTNPNVIVESFG